MTNRIDQIIMYTASADMVIESAAREADYLRWEVAGLISEELASGTTQRELADQIGKSMMHIQRMHRTFQRFYLTDRSRSFNSYYQEVKTGTSNARATQRGAEKAREGR